MITNLRVVGTISKLVRILPLEVADVARLEVGIGQKLAHRLRVSFVGLRIVFVEHDERPRLVRLGAESHTRVLRQDGVVSDQTGCSIVGETTEENRQHPCDDDSLVQSIEFCFLNFLDTSSHLYKRVCPSTRRCMMLSQNQGKSLFLRKQVTNK